jgi:Protein of unknown function (DUF2721)
MLDATVHLIQVALTPVFLLSGIAALLNLYSTRLGKVSDRLDALTEGHAPGAHSDPVCNEIRHLKRRSIVLDASVILGTIGVASTCVTILSLFLLGMSNQVMANLLLISFGVAVVCALGSIAVYGVKMLMSSRGLRVRMHVHLPTPAKKPTATETPDGAEAAAE